MMEEGTEGNGLLVTKSPSQHPRAARSLHGAHFLPSCLKSCPSSLSQLGNEAGEAQLCTNDRPDGKPNRHIGVQQNPLLSEMNHHLCARCSQAAGEGSV